MDMLNFYLTIAAFFTSYGCISGLTCHTCVDCDKVIKTLLHCRGHDVYCISYVSDTIVKRCGTHKECEMVMNPSPDHSQFMESQRSFVDGFMGFDVATMVATTFNRNDSYCCQSDLCYSQSVSMLKEEPSGVTEPLDDVTEAMARDGNSKETIVGDITNTGSPLEESFEYDTTPRHPHHKRRHTGYNAPKLRSKSDSYTTLSINSDSLSEKRSMKRSPADEVEGTDENAELKKDEKISISREEETTLSADILTITPASSTVALGNSTVTESPDDEGNAEPVSKGIRLHNFGEYILVPFAILYISW